jgi:hypothetical protein
MDTYLTTYSDHPLGRWLATLAVSLVLLALAYAHAPDPAWYLGLAPTNPSLLANSRLVPTQRGHRSAPGQAPALATTQVSWHSSQAPHTQYAR